MVYACFVAKMSKMAFTRFGGQFQFEKSMLGRLDNSGAGANPQKHKKVGLIHTSVSSSVSWILPNPQPLKSPLMLSKDATSPWSRPCIGKFR